MYHLKKRALEIINTNLLSFFHIIFYPAALTRSRISKMKAQWWSRKQHQVLFYCIISVIYVLFVDENTPF